MLPHVNRSDIHADINKKKIKYQLQENIKKLALC